MHKATVLIPAFNEEATVGRVISVARMAGFPVVVVDDGSSDQTAKVAAEAGARAIRLEKNQGKGGALKVGLEAVLTPLVILLDADLVGLKPEHLRSLLEPVASGQTDMAIGVFKAGGFMTDFGNRTTPQLSGQRACKRDLLLSVPSLASERWPEPAITAHLKSAGARWQYVELRQVSQVMKEKKRGFWRGLKQRMGMYWNLLRFRLRRHRSAG